MMTREVFVNATPEAYHFIKTTINSGSRSDHRKLLKLFDSSIFEAKNFDDTKVCISSFSWQDEDKDRNWWWQLQALPFLNWFINSIELQRPDETSRYFSICLDAIECWMRNAKSNPLSPLAWHDHASAYRVRNITNWLLFCESRGWVSNDAPRIISLAHLITEHLEWLLNDSNYSKNTNHGFDQAMIGLTIGLMYEGDQLERCRTINRERLKTEIAFAFTKEGVHKENSPGYQKMMINRLKQLRALSKLGDLEISSIGEHYIEKAESFLKAITLPSGVLPMIGDTRDGDEGLPYKQINQLDIIDYSESGYIIVRGNVLEKPFHLIFKASHLSNYHRHDDDLSLHLYFDEKVILADGGLGSHNEKDPKRVALRSKYAHNVPHLSDITPIRDLAKLDGRLPHLSLDNGKLVGTTYCYDTPVKREVDLSELETGKITVTDSSDKTLDAKLSSNIYSTLAFSEHNGILQAPTSSTTRVEIQSLEGADITKYDTYYSRKFGIFNQMTAHMIFGLTSKNNQSNKITFELKLAHDLQDNIV